MDRGKKSPEKIFSAGGKKWVSQCRRTLAFSSYIEILETVQTAGILPEGKITWGSVSEHTHDLLQTKKKKKISENYLTALWCHWKTQI